MHVKVQQPCSYSMQQPCHAAWLCQSHKLTPQTPKMRGMTLLLDRVELMSWKPECCGLYVHYKSIEIADWGCDL